MKVDRIAFVVSLVILALLYGIAANARGWFPSGLVVRAWHQGQALATRAGIPFGDQEGNNDLRDRVHEFSGVRVPQPDRVQPGMTLLATRWKGDFGQGIKLIDSKGAVVHEWKVSGEEIFPHPPAEYARGDPARAAIHGAYLYPEGDVVVNVTYVGIARLDACGKVVWSLPVGAHHSISPADDGSFWVSSGTYEAPSGTYPGIQPTYWDRILHISADGDLLRAFVVLDLLYANDLQRHIVKAQGAHQGPNNDVTHLNDVEPLPEAMAEGYPLFEAGDLLVSLRNLDLIFVFDPGSGLVKWHSAEPFIQQHDPDFMGGGWLAAFDNNRDGTDRGTMLGGSRIVAVQPHTDSVKVLFPTPSSEALYSEVLGKWQLLANGNMLLTEGAAGRVVEVAPDGSTVWEWVAEPYEDGMVTEVQEGTRYALTREQVAAWPCAPPDGGAESGAGALP